MVGGQLDKMILEVFLNLNDSMNAVTGDEVTMLSVSTLNAELVGIWMYTQNYKLALGARHKE